MKLNEQKAYHGTNVEFDKFDLNKFQRGDYGYGIYFTRSKGYAGNYGTIKEYEIPDNEYLLDWESTWQYQSEYVYNCLDKLFDDLYDNDRDNWEKIINIVDRGYGNDGEGLYMNLSEILKLSSKQTSELLYKYGIKGIDSFKGNCQVIFNPKDIKMLVTEDNIFTKTINKVKNLFKGPKLNKNFWNWFGNSKVIENGKPCICYHGSYTKIDKFSNKHGNFNTVNGNNYGAFWFTSDENVAKGYSFSAVSSNTLKQLIGVSAGELDSDELERALWEFRNEIKIAIEKAEKNPELNPSFLKIENPIIVDCKEQFYAEYGSYFAELVKQNGKDKFLLSQLERIPMFKPYLNKINNNDGVIFINACDNNDFSNTISTIYVVWNPKQIKSINNKGIWSESENVYEQLNEQLQKYV